MRKAVQDLQSRLDKERARRGADAPALGNASAGAMSGEAAAVGTSGTSADDASLRVGSAGAPASTTATKPGAGTSERASNDPTAATGSAAGAERPRLIRKFGLALAGFAAVAALLVALRLARTI